MPSTLRFSTLDVVQKMDCDRITRALYLARQGLEEWEVQELDAHLEVCPQCSRRASYTAAMLQVIQSHAPRTPAPERLRLRILQSFQHRRVASGRAGLESEKDRSVDTGETPRQAPRRVQGQ